MAQSKEQSINLKQIIGILLKRKWLIIIPIIVVGGLAYGATYLLEPEYEAATIIWIDEPSNVSRELATILGSESRGRESGSERQRRLQALQNELTSQTYLHQLVRRLDLDNNPDITRQAARMREENPSYSLEQLKLNVLTDQLRDQVDVSFVGQDQIRLAVQSHDPVLARDMADALTEILEQERTKYELQNILDNQSFADLQLEKTQRHYQQMIDSLTNAQTRLQQLQLPENITSESNRRDIVSDIDKTQIEIEDYRNERTELRSRLEDLDLGNARLKYTDSIVDLRTEIDGQVARFASMMEKYAWNEQNVINVNIRLNDNLRMLEDAIERAVDDQFASYPENQRELLKEYFIAEEHLDVARSRKNQLELSLDKIDRRINRLPKLQAEIAELERRVTDARRYRDAFRSEEATVEILSERAKERTKYRVIEPPRVPMAPVWPNRKKIMALSMVLGVLLGGGAVFIAEMLDDSFRQVDDVQDELGLPVLATIPRIERLRSIRR